jgi:hypothetical protein
VVFLLTLVCTTTNFLSLLFLPSLFSPNTQPVKACYTLFSVKSPSRQISAIMCDGCPYNNNVFHLLKLTVYSNQHKEEFSGSIRFDGLYRWVIFALCPPVSGQYSKHCEDRAERVDMATWLSGKSATSSQPVIEHTSYENV